MFFRVNWERTRAPCDMRKCNGAFREDLKTHEFSRLVNTVVQYFLLHIVLSVLWTPRFVVSLNFLRMAGIDLNEVALNLKNTLSPDANVRRQGEFIFW